MSTILTVQQFQDITGQTIRKVIALVNRVEVELLTLITKFGMQVNPEPVHAGVAAGPDQGKALCHEEKTIEKVAQSDVEALLNDFGF